VKKVRKIIVLVILALFLIVVPGVLAQKVTEPPTTVPVQNWLEGDIYTPKLLPTNPFYFLKTWKERFELIFAATPEKRVAKRVEFTTRRLAETKALFEKRSAKAEKWLERYQSQLETLQNEMAKLPEEKADWLLEHVGEVTQKHQEILLDVYEKAPEQAKKGLENALGNSSKGHQRAIEAISEQEKQRRVLKKLEGKKIRLMNRLEQIEARGEVFQQIRQQLQNQLQEQEQESTEE